MDCVKVELESETQGRALILFIQTLALYKSFTYLLISDASIISFNKCKIIMDTGDSCSLFRSCFMNLHYCNVDKFI